MTLKEWIHLDVKMESWRKIFKSIESNLEIISLILVLILNRFTLQVTFRYIKEVK